MDSLAIEAARPNQATNAPITTGPLGPLPAKRKPTKKTKKAVVFFEVEILDAKTKDKLCFLDKPRSFEERLVLFVILCHVPVDTEAPRTFDRLSNPQFYPARQSIRLDPKGKSLKDEDVLQHLPVGTTATFYFRDLGAQISWVTVFLTEYAGPLIIYLMFYFRVPFIYPPKYDFTTSKHWVVHLACMCHSFHYVKRLLETLFVHRFSHGTMPLRNIFKNCTYYWGFAAWMAYYINHPLYTPPIYGEQQVKLALIIFLFCQIGNFSIHIALRNLRPPGKVNAEDSCLDPFIYNIEIYEFIIIIVAHTHTKYIYIYIIYIYIYINFSGSKTRKIPYPTKNPFTWIFLLVSCPNYTYELGSWLGFTLMTQCLPVAFFTLVGFIQMTVWAKGKHRSYLKEFRDYPPLRSPILPFIL
ncbi:Very-long-chain enoyl-CoA reductase [Bagarius yarrelli]|uniref:Very-long-chain enoyl-CoA reductase n=1 Tax=Bagarius yarrelli TaxID=175774 RepID=A0A556TL70_BAGYA|nr:Very-long-chain enoyl-CoA reductase [Bagarius yarrelli]